MDLTINENVTLTISKDKMHATIIFNCTEKDLEEKKDFYVGEALKLLHQNKIKEGILITVLQEELSPEKEYMIAKGTHPVNGKDSVVRYFTLSERKPTIRQDGKADYYDMNFIDEVKKGDWLGEKIPPTRGTPGKTVTGEIVVPRPGRDSKLLYDRKTVAEVEEEGKIVLRAHIDGVVTFKDGKISVDNHLIIAGDVGVETGNIEFDGTVTIKGIIHSGFTVKATKDISILGEMGLSGVKMVESLKGDIFIKGGIFGQGESTVEAGRNIFAKHANDCILLAKEDIHIGYYAIGSYLKARNIIADDKNGKIIGGKIEAKGKVIIGIIGNRMERPTTIHVEGFDRQALSEQLELLLLEYKNDMLSYESLKRQVEAYEISSLKQSEKIKYDKLQNELDEKLSKVTKLDEKCKNIMNLLLYVKGEGEVTIKEEAYAGTTIEIRNSQKRILSSVKGTFYAKGRNLQFE